VERAATLVNPVKAERHPCYADAAQAFYAAEVLKEQARRKGHRAITALFPDDGPLRRNLYPKQLEFFRASLDHRELLFMAANRTGKTLAGCYADTLHLTGLYDQLAPWWEGRRFTTPIRAWVWANSGLKIKETVQDVLFGPVGQWGTGLLPSRTILHIDRASGPTRDVIETAYITHTSGGTSTLQFKSYHMGRESAEGTYRHLIHCDEEAPYDI